MPQSSALWAGTPGPAAGADPLALLDRSRQLLTMILLGVLLQLRSLELERRKLLDPSFQADPEAPALGASLLTVKALGGFLEQEQSTGDACGQTLSRVSLTVGLIRLMKLLDPQPKDPLREIEALSEPLD